MISKFQIYIGGGQGERNGKPTAALLARPFCLVDEKKLLPTLTAIVSVQQQWGDRQNRHWARLKYVVKKMGVEWYRRQVEEHLGYKLGLPLDNLDYGNLIFHHGWMSQPANGLLSFGMFIENGRITDFSPNGRIKTLIRELIQKYPSELMITPNQDVIFTNIPAEAQKAFDADLDQLGYNQRNGRPFSTLRLHSGACVGLDTCRLSYTDSEKFEPELIDQLEALGWDDLVTTIGITGCERQCFRPSTKAIGLIGSGLNRYQLRLMGTEDGRHQGMPLVSPENNRMYLRSIPREKVALVLDTLLKFYIQNRNEGETLGYFNRRIGLQAIINFLTRHSATAELMQQTSGTDDVLI